VNEQRTEEIVHAYSRIPDGTPWEELVSDAVAALLPDTDDWLVVATDDGPAIIAIADGALYTLTTVALEDRAAMSAERFDLREGRASVSVTETQGLGPPVRERVRTWHLALERGRHLVWGTTAPLEEESDLSREERVARVIADATGWTL